MESQNKIAFTEALLHYQQAIAILNTNESPNLAQILTALTSRDVVEAARTDLSELNGERLAELVELDDRLQQCAGAIAAHPQIEQCRNTLQPHQTAWWWFLKAPPPPPPKPSKYAKLFEQDWLWNFLTVVCLVGAGTFATDTVQKLSSENLNLLQTFSTIGQGAGLVLVTGGTLTDKGQKVVRETLADMGIKPKYQAEATLGFAALLLGVTYAANASIPNLGQSFYRRGLSHYNNGYVDKARLSFEEALSLAPDDANINVALGNVYETFMMQEKAEEQYSEAILAGIPEALNGLGRTNLRLATDFDRLVRAEGLFRLGLAQSDLPDYLIAAMHGHLGFTLIRQVESGNFSEVIIQARYTEAEQNFKAAIALESKIDDELPGMGMSYCYLGILYDKQEKTAAAREAWQDCQNKAFPASYNEYEDIVIYGTPEIAENVNTTKIIRFVQSD
ncbi:MAG: tetratricopeptide repeat protein [Cyanobacteria bacterium P01_E01_bin.42]